MEYELYVMGSVLIVSLLALIAALPILLKKKISNKLLLFLLSISVGVILSTVFINFLPEAVSQGYTLGIALYILFGFLTFFLLEKLVHHHHSKKEEHIEGHSHAYHLAPLNLIGDALHNFIDGVVIAASYAVNITVGVAATISIIFHELPQEIADIGVLIYSGMNKKKALLFNFISALFAVIGAVIGMLLISTIDGFNEFILPFAAGVFLYIGASNLVPELHRHCSIKDSIIHILAILLGVAIIVAVTLLGPGHVH